MQARAIAREVYLTFENTFYEQRDLILNLVNATTIKYIDDEKGKKKGETPKESDHTLQCKTPTPIRLSDKKESK